MEERWSRRRVKRRKRMKNAKRQLFDIVQSYRVAFSFSIDFHVSFVGSRASNYNEQVVAHKMIEPQFDSLLILSITCVMCIWFNDSFSLFFFFCFIIVSTFCFVLFCFICQCTTTLFLSFSSIPIKMFKCLLTLRCYFI